MRDDLRLACASSAMVDNGFVKKTFCPATGVERGSLANYYAQDMVALAVEGNYDLPNAIKVEQIQEDGTIFVGENPCNISQSGASYSLSLLLANVRKACGATAEYCVDVEVPRTVPQGGFEEGEESDDPLAGIINSVTIKSPEELTDDHVCPHEIDTLEASGFHDMTLKDDPASKFVVTRFKNGDLVVQTTTNAPWDFDFSFQCCTYKRDASATLTKEQLFTCKDEIRALSAAVLEMGQTHKWDDYETGRAEQYMPQGMLGESR